jgi:predicted nucleotidyltransferase
MKNKEEIENIIKSKESELREQFSVSKIALFGSFSDSSNTLDSDVDLLVEFIKPIGWKYLTLNLYLEKLLDRKVDLVTNQAIRPQLKSDIFRNLKFIIN